MENIKGGITCTVSSPYSTNCSSGSMGYITCQAPSVAEGYMSSMCNGIGDLHTCGQQMNYDQSICFGWKIFSHTCSAGKVYQHW